MDQINLQQKIVCFGEVLWDILPTGTVPGGAPLNIAYHLSKLGYKALILTKIGVDKPGQKLFEVMEQYNMCTDYFQISHQLQTGKVNIIPLPYNEVFYEIIQPVAWDDIEWQPEYKELLQVTQTFIYGSLSARSANSRNTLYKLLDNMNGYKVLDINLRSPHYSYEIIKELLQQADFLKINQSELKLITGWYVNDESLEKRIEILQNKFNIPSIVVTKGSEGAILNVEGTMFEHPGFKVKIAESAGSGEAFLAAIITQLQQKKLPACALEYATALGALVASYSGGRPQYTIDEIDEIITNTMAAP